jgi:hypothetical protein
MGFLPDIKQTILENGLDFAWLIKSMTPYIAMRLVKRVKLSALRAHARITSYV